MGIQLNVSDVSITFKDEPERPESVRVGDPESRSAERTEALFGIYV